MTWIVIVIIDLIYYLINNSMIKFKCFYVSVQYYNYINVYFHTKNVNETGIYVLGKQIKRI